MNDDDLLRPFIWAGVKTKRKQKLCIVPGRRADYSPGFITCRGVCSQNGDFWMWHDLVEGMYQCRKCAHRRYWGTPQYRRW